MSELQLVDENGELAVREVVQIRYTFDERITDGFYTSTALERCTRPSSQRAFST